MTTLRPYQSAALEQLRSALARGHRRVMLYSPTGSGKTETAFGMIHGASSSAAVPEQLPLPGRPVMN